MVFGIHVRSHRWGHFQYAINRNDGSYLKEALRFKNLQKPKQKRWYVYTGARRGLRWAAPV